MKICHVITRMIVGGAQENTLLTLRGHLEHGHDAVLVTGPTTGPEGKLLQQAKGPMPRVVEVPHLIRALRPHQDFLAYLELKRLFRSERFDVVHTHSSKAGIIARVAARMARVPVVVHTVHGQAFHPYQSPLVNRGYIAAEWFAAKFCDRIYCVADAMTEQCVQAGVAPRAMYQTVYSGMELEPYLEARRDPELRRRLGIPTDAPVVGKIARLFELKGYEYLFAAAPAILAAIPNVHFLIVGDGLLRAKLEAQAKATGKPERFVFAGLVPPAEVHRYTAQMDVLAHLSLREGLPRTVVQALATGVPAVGFALDGTPEAIQDNETGHICPAGDVPAVTAALLDLLRDPARARAMGERGRAFVRQRWDWHDMVRILEAEYARLLAAQAAARQ